MALQRSQLVGAAFACLVLATLGPQNTQAAVHSYNSEYFYAVGDAYIFRGGREGLYSSTQEVRGQSS